MSEESCPLCRDTSTYFYYEDKRRVYCQCKNCFLVFVPPAFHLSRECEKADYDKHQNSPDDEGYKTFLKRIYLPMMERLSPNSQGLDFGSGPGPTLSKMFQQAGMTVSLYDQYYAVNENALKTEYDFVTATEVLEHLRTPADTLLKVWSCVKPCGLLGIMTKLVIDKESFKSWHYKNDLTHVAFYSRETFEWLAGEWGARFSVVAKDAFIFYKQA